MTLMLAVIAAAVVGGASLSGGRGSALGAKLGVPIKVLWQTPNEDDAQKQVEFLEQMVLQGVDGVSEGSVGSDLTIL